MAVLLLDTSVLVDALNGKRGRTQFLDELLAQGNLLACCSINITEVYAGMRPNEAVATEEFLRSLKFYEMTWDVARLAGELKSHWSRKGHALSLPDVTVAAVAVTNGLTLLTDNQKHFPMKELHLMKLPATL
ncbi:MAG: type II toxin-antitoxin system VapC family toxin [Acidobacteriota bacterium]